MNSNQVLIWLSSLIALLLYYPLISGILKGEIKQSVATWILWVSLDTIALVSIIMQKGNYLLLVFYCTCGTIVTLSLVYKRLFSWTRFESFVLGLVVICLVVWGLSGSRWATIASTIAVCISGAPQIRDSWRTPDRTTGLIYMGYVLANSLSFFGGKTWTIEERFYPGMMALLCLTIATASFRKKDQKSPVISVTAPL
ncbi:hypothetical protein KGQ27_03165 [Patescibacteria group bacterium]|nr:hypothetical protein [Patescibacteria group bacterium]MDE1946735.1 hypothetical protein [Patescibacteria group bacterium]MDE2010962.1 hypothetical protein [Patescibacteria group bacterium]MDE2232804.1 hypothetical protein [Patescibacteria group bacterium]